eukprot:7469846-Karenia_brevis.AAC.1
MTTIQVMPLRWKTPTGPCLAKVRHCLDRGQSVRSWLSSEVFALIHTSVSLPDNVNVTYWFE